MEIIEYFQNLDLFFMTEIVASILSFMYVVLATKQNVWAWFLGGIGSLLYVYVFAVSGFYADAGLTSYYVLISVYGWFRWKKGNNEDGDSVIRRISLQEFALLSVSTAILWWVLYFVLNTYTDSVVPVGDALTTAGGIVATYMVTQKMIENWLAWILIDVIAVYLYLEKGIYPTAILYVVYTVVAIYGYYDWNRKYKKAEKIRNL